MRPALLSYKRERIQSRGETLPRPHYGYEKRQKEMAKEKKRDEKRQRKLNKKVAQPEEAREVPPDDAPPE